MLSKDIGGYVLGAFTVPTSQVAGTLASAAFDRSPVNGAQNFDSVFLFHACGAATGSPTAQTVDCKLQECATVGGTYTDVSPAVSLTQLTADDTSAYTKANVRNCLQFLKLLHTVAFTGGSTPAIPVSGAIIGGGAAYSPTY